MKSLQDTYKLCNGVEVPCVGFGTWQTPNNEICVASIKAAITCGYRHIDTAAGYDNEESVGIAVRESGIPREELFVTSKLQNDMHGYDKTMQAFEQTMRALGMDYLDLYLIHWPNPVKFRNEWQAVNAGSWKAFEELYQSGRIRAIGVSNFRPHHLEELMKTATIAPMANQLLLCPGEVQPEVVHYCRERGILLEAYSPLGTGKAFDVSEMRKLAEKVGKTIAQVCLRWSLQMDFLPLPKSVTPERIQENAEIFDFELSVEDVKMLANLKKFGRTANDPDEITF